MNLKGRVERLEKETTTIASLSIPTAWDTPVCAFPSGCICFPYNPDFGNECELEAAAALKCPLHGNRFGDYHISYRPGWLAKDAQYAHAPHHARAQFEKA